MSLRKVFLKDSVLYGITSYLSLLTGIILTPIYTRLLSKEEFGMMDLYNTFNNFAILIIPLGLTTAIIRTYSEFQDNIYEKKQNLGTLLTVLVVGCVVYALLSHVLFNILETTYFGTQVDPIIYWLSVGIVAMTVLISYYQALNRIKFKIRQYVLINLIPFLIMVFGGYYLVVHVELSIKGFFIASFFAQFIGLFLSVLFGATDTVLRYNTGVLTKALKYALPFVFVLIFMRFTNLIDRFLISNLLDLKSNGDYSIANRINSVFQIFVGAFTTAWFPYAMSIIQKGDRNKLYRKSYSYYLIGFGVICICVVLFTKELLLFFAPNYLDVELIIYPLLFSSYVAGCSYFFGLGVQIKKNTYLMIVSSLAAFVVNVLVSYYATQFFGLIGIVIGTLTSTIVWVITEYQMSKKSTLLHFDLKKLWLALLLLISISIGVYILNRNIHGFWTMLFLKSIILITIIWWAQHTFNFIAILRLDKFLNKSRTAK